MRTLHKHLTSQTLLKTWLTLAVIAVVGGCASKKTQPPPAWNIYPDQTASPRNPAPPADPTAPFQTAPQTVAEAPPMTPPPKENPRLGLVLGGAGVASFATVGLLKRFHEENIKFDFIVASGWPALFAVGRGFMNSVHDLEWFATRLQEKDIASVSSCSKSDDLNDLGRISNLIKNGFQEKNLSQAGMPIIISAANTDLGGHEISDSGDWRNILLKTMAVPGLYRPYPPDSSIAAVAGVTAVDVDEAFRRGAKVVVAIEMYDDYFTMLKKPRKTIEGRGYQKAYLTRLENDLIIQMRKATVAGRIVLHQDPQNLGAKRAAIAAGYREGTRITRQLRSLLSSISRRYIDLSAKAE